MAGGAPDEYCIVDRLSAGGGMTGEVDGHSAAAGGGSDWHEIIADSRWDDDGEKGWPPSAVYRARGSRLI